ncbi:MAG: cardiolipin synthase B [Oceanospirillales bacterium]|uniref:Phosphatidylserine/phosphatidylglycerophosphate/ cardiolipin synthase-like enzyme n=1 Tax=Marinobacterium halophilum TaxID=267374 RepID=A0A2P8F293_9GAMM|nr:phospholipase D-like domain-containing protein [Marinobacterium halophilum]MBR9827963.1 cardiolipin synthase B [Oceanospirillales bacterium]PSL15831.1 phosphatidylserine/phosphatidylglycerophosphate/cardiolipin synthase-like enzyme [Marinobacterium halophilum]
MRQRFNWRGGNQIQLMVDGEQFFPAMLAAIEQAESSLLLEFYLAISGKITDRFIHALTDAARRGVIVRLIIDGFGGRGLSRADRQRLQAAGIRLVIYNPLQLNKLTRNFARDHRKLMVVDERIAFIGGAGLADEYWLSERPGCPWHEVMCRIEGPVVADLVSLYQQLWFRCTGKSLPAPSARPDQGPALMKVTTVQGLYQQDIKVAFLNHVNAARERVWLATAYFMPSFSIRSALRKAAERGVDVRVMVAGPYTDQFWVYHASKRYYRRLLKAGVRIYEYEPRFLHAKVGLVDTWVSLGSCNLDHWNLRWNLEANVEVVEPALTAQVEQLIRADLEQCTEITASEWSKRPWYRKLKELVWALLSQLVLKIK